MKIQIESNTKMALPDTNRKISTFVVIYTIGADHCELVYTAQPGEIMGAPRISKRCRNVGEAITIAQDTDLNFSTDHLTIH